MALTKITTGLLADDAVSTASLADGIIQAAHLHASHGITTSNIAEGSNEYHTTARARAAVSVGGSLAYNSSTGVVTFTQRTDGTIRGLVSVTDSGGDGSLAYNNSTGVITYTGPSASEVRAHISAGTGIAISSGAISSNDSAIVHDSLSGFVANEHLDWTQDQGSSNIHVNNLTPVALTTVQTAANQSAQLALTTQEGDVVIRTDEKKTYMRNSGSAGDMNDFTLMQTPTDVVTSVSGSTGAVADSDIDHDALANFVANEHIDWTSSSAGTLHATNIANDAIDSQHYAASSIDLEHMSANSIDSPQYVDGSIDLAHMSVNSIDSDQYVDGSIDTAHIAASNITNALMADDAIGVAELSATGTASSSTFLRGDNAWTAVTPAAIATYGNASNNRVITSVDSDEVNAEANLTFDGSTLAVTGAATISTTLGVTGNTTLTGPDLTITADNARLLVEEADGTNIAWVGDHTGDGHGGLLLYNHGGTATVKLTADSHANYINNGNNFGIGTTSPEQVLHLRKASGNSALLIESVSGGDPELHLNSEAANRNGVIRFNDNGSAAGKIIYNHANDSMAFHRLNEGTPSLYIQGGKVGINDSSPSYTLDVDGDINFTGTLREDGSAYSAGTSTGKAMVLAMVFG